MASPTHDWAQISKLLDQALALPPESRITWLEQLDGQFSNLKPQLRDMLSRQAEIETNSFLSPIGRLSVAPADTRNGDRVATPAWVAGGSVGPYRLLRPLGEGGMGTVWLAERTDGLIKRAVALKLPHIARYIKGIAERFAREREILSTLTHANIAQLYDAGMDSAGQPYLALEYVEGVALTQYCNDKKLSVRSRLELFQQVLAAVQYAHTNLVLHRDLKPSNILVNENGAVKLLDFGIAKLLSEGTARETELTQMGGRALTLDYASPEQIMGQPLTTASDVYSLGVLLCELLTGERPYKLKRGTRAELEEAILAADPARPSALIKTAAQSEHRSSPPRQLVRQLAGDLDSITGKALAKNPAYRYASVAALADDIERHLRGDIVLAQPESRWYRSRKFVARNKLAIGAVCGVIVSLIAGLGTAMWQADKARAQSALASTEAKNATLIKNFLMEVFRSGDAGLPDGKNPADITLREIAEQASTRLLQRSELDSTVRTELATSLADVFGTMDAGERERDLLDLAIKLARESHGNQPHPELAYLLVKKANQELFANKHADAEQSVAQAEAIMTKLGDTESLSYAKSLLVRAHVLKIRSTTQDETVRALLIKASDLFRNRYPKDEGRIGTLFSLARLSAAAGNVDEALKTADEVVAVVPASQRSRIDTPSAFSLRASMRDRAGDPRGAEDDFRSASKAYLKNLGSNHFLYLQNEGQLGDVMHRTGDRAQGLEIIEATTREIGVQRANTSTHRFALNRLGLAYLREGRTRLAIPVLVQTRESWIRAGYPHFANDVTLALIDAYIETGDLAAATATREAYRAEILARGNQNFNQTALAAADGRLALARNQPEVATQFFESALNPGESAAKPDERVQTMAHLGLADAFLVLRNRQQASFHATEALRIANRPPLAADALLKQRALQTMGRSQCADGQRELARRTFGESLALLEQRSHPGSARLAAARALRARCD